MEKAFMGISIKNPFYSRKENIIKAINLAKDFSEFLIFPVDYPYRLSLEVFEGISGEEAKSIVLEEGKRLIKFLIRISKPYKNIRISSWKELENKEYDMLLKKVEELEEADIRFSNLIKEEFTGTIINRIKELPKEDYKRNERLCKKFLMEEIAMFSYLVFSGYSTRISKYSRSKAIDYFLKNKKRNLVHIQL